MPRDGERWKVEERGKEEREGWKRRGAGGGSGRGEERKRKGRGKGTGGRVVERKERKDSNGVWGAGGDKRHRRARSA